MAKLKIKDEHGKERLHELVDSLTSVGRASANTIQITDEKSSRSHFKIERRGEAFRLIDLGSTNGTKLNGTKIGAEIDLKTGDQLCVGKTTFTFDDGTPPKPETAQAVGANGANGANGAVEIPGGETMEMDAVKPAEVKAPEPAKAAEADNAPKFVLKMLEGKTPGKVFELGVSALTIGRHSSNTIQIVDDATSNYHAEIGREPIGYVLTDLGSTNGTRVKLKNKTEFEKVIKTPLSAGMQIRVGKTLLEFENHGKPVEDEALFGTVALDPQNLDQVLANPGHAKPPGSSRRVLAALVVLTLLAGGAGAAYKLRTPPAPPPPPPGGDTAAQLKNIPNADFEEGPDDVGNPKHFKVRKAAPGVHVEIIPDAQYKGAAGKFGLRIGKGGAKNPSKATIVETEELLSLQSGKTYEFTGMTRSEGDGVFGLYVRWINNDRTYSECPAILLNTQSDWRELKAVLTPPAWARHACLGLMAQGPEGHADFDQLDLKAATEPPASAPQVNYGGVSVVFEGTKGCFSVVSNSAPVVLDGSLLLVSGESPPNLSSDLSIAFNPASQKDGDKVSFSGGLTDFVLQALRDYRIEAAPGATGVDLRAVVNAGTETGCTPQLVFAVVGPLATGDIDVTRGDTPERLNASESKAYTGVKEVLFNAGKSPQLVLLLPGGAEVDLKRQGNRRQVSVKFGGNELGFGFALESPAMKTAMKTLIDELRKSTQMKQWGVAEVKIKALREKFESRFPEARDEATAAQMKLDDDFRNAKQEIERKIQTIKEVKTAKACDDAKDRVDAHKSEWTGSDRMKELDSYGSDIEELRKSVTNDDTEKKAQEILDSAKQAAAAGVYIVAISKAKKLLLENPVYSKTKAAEEAKTLLPVWQEKDDKKNKIDEIKQRLDTKTKNYRVAGNTKGELDEILKDPDYPKYKDDLPEWKQRADELQKKLGDK